MRDQGRGSRRIGLSVSGHIILIQSRTRYSGLIVPQMVVFTSFSFTLPIN